MRVPSAGVEECCLARTGGAVYGMGVHDTEPVETCSFVSLRCGIRIYIYIYIYIYIDLACFFICLVVLLVSNILRLRFTLGLQLVWGTSGSITNPTNITRA